jgi:hypothetical protein
MGAEHATMAPEDASLASPTPIDEPEELHVPGPMSKQERDEFLAAVHVAVLAVDEPGRGPLAIPIWYLYEGSRIELSMGGESLKARLLRAAGRATLTVQSEVRPYGYVSVEGPVEVLDEPADVLALAPLPRRTSGAGLRRGQLRHGIGGRQAHSRALADLLLRLRQSVQLSTSPLTRAHDELVCVVAGPKIRRPTVVAASASRPSRTWL